MEEDAMGSVAYCGAAVALTKDTFYIRGGVFLHLRIVSVHVFKCALAHDDVSTIYLLRGRSRCRLSSHVLDWRHDTVSRLGSVAEC